MNDFEIGIVHRNVERADADAVKRLSQLGVATIHEAQGRTGMLAPRIRPVYPSARLCGTALTVLMQPGDNWMLHVALEFLQPNDVLVAACTSDCSNGFFGELLATAARAHGAVGLVIDGGCRDAADLEEMDFPVFSRAIHAQGTNKAVLGSVNVPIVCAGARVAPGDVVIGDRDGVVVVPKAQAATVADAGEKRDADESRKRSLFQAGQLSLDIYSMRERLENAGLRYVD